MQPEFYQYPVDGLIFEMDNIDYSRSLPATAHHEGCRMALKWADEMYETQLLNIEWQAGRNGQITPVAIFKPVEIDGVIIQKASLHNISILESKLKKPYVGQYIEISRRNQVIPQIERAKDENGQWI